MLKDAGAPRGTGGTANSPRGLGGAGGVRCPGGAVHARKGRCTPREAGRNPVRPGGAAHSRRDPGAPLRRRSRPEGTVHSRREPGAPRWGRALPEGSEGTRCAPAAPCTPVRARVLSRSRGRRGAAARRRCRAGRPRPCRRSPGRTRCPCFPRKAGGGRAGQRAASAGRCPG